MAEHDEHSSFIKTPQQLITIVLLAFVVPIFGIVLLVQFVVDRPRADPSALTPEAVSARIQPVGKVEFGAAGAAARQEQRGHRQGSLRRLPSGRASRTRRSSATRPPGRRA